MANVNERKANGSRWRRIRKRWQAIGAPCALCGRPIDYSMGMIVSPLTGKVRPHPMSLAIDHIDVIRDGGSVYDFDNTQPTHWICNARKGAGRKTSAGTTRKDTATLPLPQPWEL